MHMALDTTTKVSQSPSELLSALESAGIAVDATWYSGDGTCLTSLSAALERFLKSKGISTQNNALKYWEYSKATQTLTLGYSSGQTIRLQKTGKQGMQTGVTSTESSAVLANSLKSGLTSGAKFDTNKIQMELIPPELLTAVGTILTYGAKKYAPRNWEKGINYSRIYGSILRHLTSWASGELLDLETGKSHLWHAACGLSFLIAYEARGMTSFNDMPHGK